jgi:hypothetical protein
MRFSGQGLFGLSILGRIGDSERALQIMIYSKLSLDFLLLCAVDEPIFGLII